MKACMVSYSNYESDSRVRRYAETLCKRGYKVDVLAIRQEGESSSAVIEGVRVFRIQLRVRDEKSKIGYLRKLVMFFLRSMFFLTWEQIKEPYDLIHVHSVPDFEVFAALVPKLMGCKVILDIHDIVPEFYASKFKTSSNSAVFKLLVAVERMSAGFSDHVIAANHIWEERLIQRSVRRDKCTAMINYPDTDIFRPGRDRNDGKFIILYPGTLNYHQGVDIAIRAFALIKDKAPQAEFHIYGGDQRDALKALITELGLQDRVLLREFVTRREIVSIMGNADLGVVPKRKNSFGNEAFSTKILEFMCLGVPVLIPDTAIDSYYFNDSVAQFFRADDVSSLSDGLLSMIQNPVHRKDLVDHANEFVKQYTWESNQDTYLNIVDSLVNSNRKVRGGANQL